MKKSLLLSLTVGLLMGSSAAWAESAAPVKLHPKGTSLHYVVDLSSLVDASLWTLLERNRQNLITVDVRLRDITDGVRMRQSHSIRLNFISTKQIVLTVDQNPSRIFSKRKDVLRALQTLPGTPIVAEQFKGSRGYLEVIAMVNPYRVYSYPSDNTAVAHQDVVPKTYYDRRLRLRSKNLP